MNWDCSSMMRAERASFRGSEICARIWDRLLNTVERLSSSKSGTLAPTRHNCTSFVHKQETEIQCSDQGVVQEEGLWP